MVQNNKSPKGGTISGGVWTAQLLEHIQYFDSHQDLREIKIVLPFGIPRERKPRNYEKQEAKKIKETTKLRAITSSPLGVFNYDPQAEIKPWKPRLKPVRETNDQVQCKPALFILRHDPADKKVMYLEQDLMAKPVSDEVDKKTGFTYRIELNRNLIIRKYLARISETKLVKLVNEFTSECNRMLFMYCDTR